MRRMILAAAAGLLGLTMAGGAQTKTPAALGFDRLKALEGEWIDVDGIFGVKGAVAVTYK